MQKYLQVTLVSWKHQLLAYFVTFKTKTLIVYTGKWLANSSKAEKLLSASVSWDKSKGVGQVDQKLHANSGTLSNLQ